MRILAVCEHTVGMPEVLTTVDTPDSETDSISPDWLDTTNSLPSGPNIGDVKPEPHFAYRVAMASGNRCRQMIPRRGLMALHTDRISRQTFEKKNDNCHPARSIGAAIAGTAPSPEPELLTGICTCLIRLQHALPHCLAALLQHPGAGAAPRAVCGLCAHGRC